MNVARAGIGNFRAPRYVCAVALLACTLTLQACSADCPGTAPTCVSAHDSESRFTLTLAHAPASMDAMIIELKSDDPTVFELTPSASLEQTVSANANQTVWRAVIIGGAKSGILGTLTVRAPHAALPTVSVIDVAADESGDFLPLATNSVSLNIARVK